MSYYITSPTIGTNTDFSVKKLFDYDEICVFSDSTGHSYSSDSKFICIGSGYFNNYTNLCFKLNLAETSSSAEIVLKGYKEYSTDFFHQLDGSFSFGIVDILNKKIFGFRDHFGKTPLFFQVSKDGFILSDTLLNILKNSPTSINANAIQNYFSFEESNNLYTSETFYENVFRVIPGHFVSYEEGKTSQSLFWQPSLHHYANLKPEEQAQIFKEKLINTVNKSVKPGELICTNLSGGLDSSSISSISKMLHCEVNSIYFNTNHPSTDERMFANTVVNKWQLQHFEIQSNTDPLILAKQLIAICSTPDMLFMPATSFFSLGQKVKQLACTKILTGDGGDSIVAYGNEYFQQLYEQKNWEVLKQSISSYVKNRDLSFYFEGWQFQSTPQKIQTYTNYFFGGKIIAFLKNREFRKAVNVWYVATRFFDFSPIYIFEKGFSLLKSKFSEKRPDFQLLKHKQPDLKSERFDLSALPSTFSLFQKEHFGYTFTNLNVAVTEQQNAIMKSIGIEALHPFLDKELLEISLAVSSATRFNEGLGRGILRWAMVDILPEEVRLRTSKVDFSDYLFSYFEKLWNSAKQEIGATHKVWEYVDKEVFEKLIDYIFERPTSNPKKTNYIWLANRTIQLALWLDYFHSINIQESK